MLLYSSKGVTATNQFKVHGQLPLHGMIVSEERSSLTLSETGPQICLIKHTLSSLHLGLEA